MGKQVDKFAKLVAADCGGLTGINDDGKTVSFDPIAFGTIFQLVWPALQAWLQKCRERRQQQDQTPQLLNAGQMGYQANLDAFNAQQQGLANTMGGLTNLASTAFMFSDRRLKSRIKRVGTHDIGVGIYEYDMAGYRQRGVIAQEVEAVRPDLVKRHPSGYLMVNYGELR